MLDIGCGGGLLSEPLARLGAAMVGVDPSETNIAAARQHAEQSELAIDYRCTTAEELAGAGEQFDVVLAMEVVEHVADVPLFVQSCAEMVKPGGLMIAATLNRTLKSFALAIVGAEYILRWLPVGSHRWDKFVTPNELEIAMEQGGLRVTGSQGVIYNILADRWQLSSDTDVNYMLVAEKRLSCSPQAVLWIPFTLLAAAGQTARNAMQRELTAALGTVGATHVRFLFGFPFALIFLAARADGDRAAAAHAADGVLAMGACSAPVRRSGHRVDARDHERPLVRCHHRLHQDRGDPGRAVRPDLPRRSADARHGRRDPGGDRGRGGDVAQRARAVEGGYWPVAARPVLRRDVRALRGRLSRRDPVARAAELRAGRDLDADGRPPDAGGRC